MPRPPPPKIDHPYVFSVSQIDNFELCNRKWAFEKIDKLEKEDTEATLLGSEVHDQLEAYLDKGTPLDPDTQAGSIAMAGMKYLPLPMSPGMRIERWFAIQYGVAWYRGLKDIEIIRTGRIPQVKDHKTTKNFSWQKRPKDLLKDTQACLYSYDAMEKTGFDEVDLEWIYYRTTGARRAENTTLRIKRDQVEETMIRIDKTAQKMIHVLQTVTTGMDAEPNFASCSAYGGCPHRDVRCQTTSSAVLKSMIRQKMKESKSKKTEDGTETFLEKLKNRQKEISESEEKVIKKNKKTPTGITSKEREEDPEIPGPPPPVKANGVWYQADFNEDTWEWVYPEEVTEALAKKKSKAEKEDPPAKAVEVSDEPSEEEEEEEETPLERRKRLKAQAAEAKAPKEARKVEEEEPDDSELASLLLKLFKHLVKAVKNS